MALNGRCGRVPGEAGGELAIFPGGEEGGARVMYGLVFGAQCSAACRGGGRPGPASSCQPAQHPQSLSPSFRWRRFHTHHSGTKGPPAESRHLTTPRQPLQDTILSRLAGRVSRRGEARPSSDRRGFGCRKRWNSSCRDDGCGMMGLWTVLWWWVTAGVIRHSHSHRGRGRGLISYFLSCLVARVYFWGKRLWRSSGWRRLGTSPCLFDCGDRGGANYQRVP
jgi:hypothetical protein